MTEEEKDNPINLSEVLQLVIHANEKYSGLLRKQISFPFDYHPTLKPDQQIPLLALLNNIVANAVEAIADKGEIHISMYEEANLTGFL